MDLTQKITRDINQFKNVPSPSTSTSTSATSSSTPSESSFLLSTATTGWYLSSIFTPYTIGIVVIIVLMFGAWFAWDWYKTHKDVFTFNKKTSTVPTINPDAPSESPEVTQTDSIPPVVTNMSPLQYAKYQADQQALETALSSKTTGGEPIPDDAADGAGKAGWCYIGEDQGLGVCASVQQNDQCMSGRVYPTESECRAR